MAKLSIIRGEELNGALDKKYRVYLTGRLKKPQTELKHIEDDIEVGMSYYEQFTADTPHMHPVATEHAYILEGCIRLKLLDSGEEYELKAGDFFVLPPNSPYVTKNQAGTRVFFIKSPEGNDKTPVEVDEKTKKWLESWD